MPKPARPAPDSETRLLRTAQERGILSADQVDEALRTRQTLGEAGITRALEDVLFERGVFTPEQVRAFRQLAQAATPDSDATALAGWERSPRLGAEAPRSGQACPEGAQRVEGPDAVPGEPFGRYRLMEPLGHGGMGIVWKAWDTDLRRVVALKQILGGDAVRGQTIERFLREARAAARLRHPNIVPVYDVGVIDGRHYLTADFVEGTSLDRRIREEMSTRDAVILVKTVAEALQYAHDQGVVHRDIKPGNILLDRQGVPHVADFGLAKDASPGSGPALTVSGDLLGTPSYMSPEQARGRPDEQGPASDQFSLGVMLYEMATGMLPFGGASLQDILNAITDGDPAPPTRHQKKLHADVETVILQMLEKDPAKRYPSMRDLAADLGRILDAEPIEARRPGLASRVFRKAAKHKRTTAVVLLVVLVGAGLGIYAISARSGEQEALALLEKARLVQDVHSRWERESQAVIDLQACFFDESIGLAEKPRRAEGPWKRVARLVEETPSDPTSQAAMMALSGWARRYAGRPEESLAWLAKARSLDPDLPYGALLEGLLHLSEYYLVQPLPQLLHPRFTRGPQDFPPESEGQRARRERVEALLAEAARAKVWGRTLAEGARRALESIDALRGRRYAEAESHLTASLREAAMHPFRMELLYARAKVRYLDARFDEAMEDLEEVGKLCPRFRSLALVRGEVRTSSALGASDRGNDPRDAYRAAIEDFTMSIDAGTEIDIALDARAIAERLLGTAEDARGGDPIPWYDRAIADHTRALSLSTEPKSGLYNRACTRHAKGEALLQRGGAARPCYEEALADFETHLVGAPGDAWGIQGRGKARLGVARCLLAEGEDARESMQAAIRDLDEAMRLDPEDESMGYEVGLGWLWFRKVEEARGEDPRGPLRKALAAFDAAAALDPGYSVVRGGRGYAWFCMGGAERALGSDPRAALRHAVEDLRASMSSGPPNSETRLHLVFALHGLGCAEADAGADPRVVWEEAVAEARRVAEAGPGDYRPHTVLCDLLAQRGELDSAVDACARADELDPDHASSDVLAMLKDLRGRAKEGGLAGWKLLCWLSEEAARRDDYARARVLAEDALAAALPETQGDDESRRLVQSLHYNQACFDAALCQAPTEPHAPPFDLGAEVRARRLDEAYAHLEEAIRLGWNFPDLLANDSDLEPLRADPRWPGVVDSLPRK